ncbi:hypothetical protein Tco_1229507 [Tanacetum coccineum]
MEPLDTFLMGDEIISTIPAREIDEFIKSSVEDLAPIPRESEMFCPAILDIDSFLETFDTLSSGIWNLLLILEDIEELERLLANNPIPIPKVTIFLYFEQLLDEDTFSDLSLEALLPTKSSSLVLPLPDFKQVYLKEVARFNPFFSLTQSGDVTWVMKRPSYRFPLMPLPRQVAYSPKVVMYRYFHPHLILSDGCDHEPRNK